MRRLCIPAILVAALGLTAPCPAQAERQVTYSAKNHNLDNNDNFSPDGRYLCYDTRATAGPGIGNGQTIEMVEVATGIETILYAPESVTGEQAAPGVGAVSFSPVAWHVAFIHGPPLDTVDARGYYGKRNRNGAQVAARPGEEGELTWLDHRDTADSRPTLPGAHRGGTHRHEYTLDGSRIGCTYDDALLPEYGRTIAYMEPHPDAPGEATHWFAVLVKTVPEAQSRPGDLVKAYGDSWVGRDGRMRAFIGATRLENAGVVESLYVVEVPPSVDITTADAGSAPEYPTPPEGVRVRRLTHTAAGGTVRASHDGRRIAYYAEAEGGTTQVFVIASDGSDQNPDPAKRPVQVTHFEGGVDSGLRWHPSGRHIFCAADGGIAAVCVEEGAHFGETRFITPHGDGRARIDLVVSPDGSLAAYGMAVPAFGGTGERVYAYDGSDFVQLFVAPTGF